MKVQNFMFSGTCSKLWNQTVILLNLKSIQDSVLEKLYSICLDIILYKEPTTPVETSTIL